MSRPNVSVSAGARPALDRAGVGVGDELLQLGGVRPAVVEQRPEHVVVPGDARPEVGVVVVLDEDREAAAQADVVGHVAGLVAEGLPALAHVPEVHGVPVGEAERAVLLLERRVDRRQHLVPGVLQDGRIAVGAERPGIGHRLLVERAVGRVAVDEEQRVPAPEDVLDEAGELRALELHGVAVEVQVLAVVADARTLLRADLAHAVARVHLVVAVGVEDRGDEQDDPVEIGRFGVEDDVAGQHQGRFLALDLAGVDVGLDVDDDALVVAQGQGVARRGLADDEERDGPAFGRDGQGLDPDERRELLEVADEAHDLGAGRGRGVIGRLGGRLRARGRGRGRGRNGSDGGRLDRLGTRALRGALGRRRLAGGRRDLGRKDQGGDDDRGDEEDRGGKGAGCRLHEDLRCLDAGTGSLFHSVGGTMPISRFPVSAGPRFGLG